MLKIISIISILAVLSLISFNYAHAIDNNCGVSVWTIFQLSPILGCIEDRLDRVENLGQMVIEAYQPITKTNIGTSYVPVYPLATFDDQDKAILDCTYVKEIFVIWTWDYVGTGNQQLKWVDRDNTANTLYETSTFNVNQIGISSGWVEKPTWCNTIEAIEIYAKSDVGTDDPVYHGYSILVR